jgi:hypothetical protein
VKFFCLSINSFFQDLGIRLAENLTVVFLNYTSINIRGIVFFLHKIVINYTDAN